MADDLSLLLKIRGDNASAKATVAETRAAIAALRSSTTTDFSQMQAAAKTALTDIGNHVNLFIGERVPLVGGAFLRVSESLRSLGGESQKATPHLNAFNKTVDDLSKTTGKSNAEIVKFLNTFTFLPNASERALQGYIKFGSKFDDIQPKLEKAVTQIGAVAAETEGVGGAFAALSGPIGIAVVGLLAIVAAGVAATVALVELTVKTAEYEGKLLDLNQKTGVAVETLSTLQILFSTTGGSIEAGAASLGLFQKNMEAAQDPTSKMGKLFEQFDIDTLDVEKALRQAFTALAKIPEGAHQTAVALELFGRSGKDVLAIVKESKGDLDAATQKFREMGLIVGGEAAKQADHFNDELTLLQGQVQAIGREIGEQLLPILLDMVKSLGEIARAVGPIVVAFGPVFKLAMNEASAVLTGLALTFAAVTQNAKETGRILDEFRNKGKIEPLDLGVIPGLQPVPIPKAEDNQAAILKAAAAEADRIAKDRIAKAEQAFKLGQTTRALETESIINANKLRLQSEHLAIEAEIEEKLKSLLAAKDDVEKRKTITEQIVKLQQDSRNKESEIERDTNNRRADFQVQERKSLLEHEKAKLDILLQAGQAKIAIIQSEVRADIKTREDGEKEIEAIEDAGFKARKAQLQNEQKNALPDDKKKFNDQLAALDVERTANEQKQAERRTANIRQANTNDIALERQLFAIREAERQDEQRAIDDLLSRQAISESAAIALRMGLLEEEHKERLVLIDTELNQQSTSAERKIELDNEKIQSEQTFTNETERLTNQRIDAIHREDAARAPGTEKKVPSLTPSGDQGIGEPPLPPALLAQLDAFSEAQKAINSHFGEGTDKAAAFTAGLNVLAQTAGLVANAVGQAVHAFVLFGSVEGGFRKFAAEVIASIAQMATVNAIFEAAQGLAMLALSYFTGNPRYALAAGAHFAAAAMYGGIAAVAIPLGRAVAGDKFKNTGASGGGGSSGGGSAQPLQTIITPRNQAPAPIQPQTVRVLVQVNDSMFGKAVTATVVNNFNDGGEIRETLANDGR